MVGRRPHWTDLWKSLFWVSNLNTRAQMRTNWTVRSRMAPQKSTAVRAVYQMKEEIKKCLRTWMHQLLHPNPNPNFLSVWCVQALTKQLILFQIFLIFFFSFLVLCSSDGLWKGCSFFPVQVNRTKTCLISEIRSVFLALSPFPTVAT